MAVFASITHQPDEDDFWGKHHRQVFVIVGDDDYPTGGYPVNSNDFGGGNIRSFRVIGANAAAAKMLVEFDYANSKFIVSYPGGGDVVPSALTDPIVTSGAATASAVSDTTPTITAGRGVEVADDTDLSTCTWKVEVLSF